MVGNVSLGCTTCKARKVRCDLQKPICMNCQKGKRQCSGPLSPFMKPMVLEKQDLPTRHKNITNLKKGPAQGGRKALKMAVGNTNDSIGSFYDMQIQNNTGFDQQQQNESDPDIPSTIMISIPRRPASSQSSMLAQEISSRLTSVGSVGLDLKQLGFYMPLLSQRIGHNEALDAAVQCLLRGHDKLLRRAPRSQTGGLNSYVYALSLLRRDIENVGKDPNIQAAELVCAAMVLSSYELFKYETARAWIAHAGGVSAIIRAWGPERIVSDFDISLFTSHYGAIVMSSLFTGQDCYLTSPEWEPVKKRCMEQKSHLDLISFDIVTRLSTLSPLVRETRTLLANPSSDYSLLLFPSLEARVQAFRAELQKNSNKIVSDFNNPKIVMHRPGTGNPPFLQQELHFSNHKIAMRYGLYWASAIIADKLLQRLYNIYEPDSAHLIELEDEMQLFAVNIMQSVAYLRTVAPFGALYVTFALQVVAAVIEPESTRVWIKDALVELFSSLGITFDVNQMAFVGALLTGGSIQLPWMGKATKD
ncbi:hypothetical protein F5884DRAFT_789454 [Xylogone sp. PMI_703]|nr:hypothetical protein F5884DRAFT_789454 [Xylogone sp. PMI_703]